MGMLRIDNLDDKVKDEVIKLKAEGYSNSAIADEMNLKHQIVLNKDDVRIYFDKRTDQAVKVMKEDTKLQSKLAKQYFSSIEQLNTLNAEMWEFWYSVKKNPETMNKSVFCPKCSHKFMVQVSSYLTLIKTAEHLLNQIRHVDAVLGKLHNKQFNITYNYTDLSKKLVQIMPKLAQRLERQGIIKIKKRKKLNEFVI